ncbi:ORF_64 [Adoxophyes orana granulovirus]|uniref:ORF_64 n=1 Tax=Adoxophyes orana granulovirus TaxID=170617 RepID=Q7T9V1_GVAO|nr:ORF_64 [Adoxophyes orana granulovirus]AAP85701.1 ORF_64 [Adoxophyes orana granulovirus]
MISLKMLMLATFFVINNGFVYSMLGTIKQKNTLNPLCLRSTQLNFYLNAGCAPLEINVHKYNNNLILNFKKDKVCNYMCINKCGNVYYDNVFHIDDCLWTTAAFQNMTTLSVHRGNFSDFMAYYNNNLIPISFSYGNNVEKFYANIQLQFDEIKPAKKESMCHLVLTPYKHTKACNNDFGRIQSFYNDRNNYYNYTWWEKLLILFRLKTITTPNVNETLSYYEYKMPNTLV